MNCPICDGEERTPLFSLPDGRIDDDRRFTVHRCARCAALYLHPRPTQLEMAEKYNYTRLAAQRRPSREAILALKETPKNHAKRALVRRYAPAARADGRRRLLDIGTGPGDFPALMRGDGWDCRGTELMPDMPDHFGIPIDFGADAVARQPAESFDVVTMWAVLSHLHQPHAMLAEVRRVLVPGGRLLILTSRGDRAEILTRMSVDLPRTLFLPTPGAARKLLERHGFELYQVDFRLAARIFSSTMRGALLLQCKRLLKEYPLEELIEIYRNEKSQPDFWRSWQKKPSLAVRLLNLVDKAFTMLADRLLILIGHGDMMVLVAEKRSDAPVT